MKRYFANKAVERNKKPLKNIIYKFEFSTNDLGEEYENYKFKELGYIVLYWKYQGDPSFCFDGVILPSQTKTLLGEKQWSKFCQGKREFTIQRRIDKKNVPKN